MTRTPRAGAGAAGVQCHNAASACVALLCVCSHRLSRFLKQLSLASPFLPPQCDFPEIRWFTVARQAVCLGLAGYVLHRRWETDPKAVNSVIKHTGNAQTAVGVHHIALYSRSHCFASFN